MAVDHAEMLEVLLASTATWQAVTGTATLALARAYVDIYERLESAGYPRALIQDDPLWGNPVATGTGSGGGALSLSFWVKPDLAVYTSREARRTWLRGQLADIKNEMEVLSYGRTTPAGYTNSHLLVKRITWSCPPFELRAHETPVAAATAAPIVWGSEFLVEW